MESTNPYAPIATGPTVPSPSTPSELAGRFTRFAATMIDGFLMLIVLVPIQLASGYIAQLQAGRVNPVLAISLSLAGFVVFLAFHGYPLVRRGQSLGKMATGIQIIDQRSESLLPPVRVIGYRYLWLLPLVLVVAFIPGTLDDNLVNLISLIDILFIFSVTRQCLHDRIAGSRVVIYRPGRPRGIYPAVQTTPDRM